MVSVTDIVRAGAIVVLAAVALAGCRESEQNRPLSYDKGHYQGKQDEALSEADVRQLQQRGNAQKF